MQLIYQCPAWWASGSLLLLATSFALLHVGMQENQQGQDDPEDLQSKLAALERAMVDRDLLILRQNEDIASLEDQLARASTLHRAAQLQSDSPR